MRRQTRNFGLRTLLVPLIISFGVAHAFAQPAQDSARIFEKMATVLESPRCLNCHTATNYPRQSDDRHRHLMNVSRGPDDHGAPGFHCTTCHQAENQSASGVPGAPDWHLAPLRMAWEGLSVGELCRALSDPEHGDMKPEKLVSHFNTKLVEWAWKPGNDIHGQPRTTPPVSHDAFVSLARQWIAGGAKCPQ
jgi:hypothetical protein